MRSAALEPFTNLPVEKPDLFIKVSGSTKATVVLPTRPLETCAFLFTSSRNCVNPALFPKNSTAMRPALCRVESYFSPGLPKPTITHAIGTGYHAVPMENQDIRSMNQEK